MAQYLTRNATQRITLGLVPVDSKTDALNRDLATPRSTALLLNRVVITFLQKNYN